MSGEREISVQEWKVGFSITLAELMDYYGMTRKELSQRSGISEASLCRYLNCERIPTAITIVKLSYVFHVPYSTFLEQGGIVKETIRAKRGHV